ncbi:hypothetical protein ES703_84334 [subsurface metagenome]
MSTPSPSLYSVPYFLAILVAAADGNVAPETDITGRERFNVPYADNNGAGEPNYVDMGAYESPTVWFVDVNANPDGNGTSWDDAFDDLQDALVNKALDGNEIWVAGAAEA